MIKDVAQVHITEAELARDVHAVLEKVREGEEVIIEEGYRRVAVIKPIEAPGRSIDECIALARAYEERLGYAPVPDPDSPRMSNLRSTHTASRSIHHRGTDP